MIQVYWQDSAGLRGLFLWFCLYNASLNSSCAHPPRPRGNRLCNHDDDDEGDDGDDQCVLFFGPNTRSHETKYHSRILPPDPESPFPLLYGSFFTKFQNGKRTTQVQHPQAVDTCTFCFWGREVYNVFKILINLRKFSYSTLETRRELRPKRIPQLFLGSLLETRRSAIGQFFFPVPSNNPRSLCES